MGNLIMPKQTSEPIKFYTTLSILYDAYRLGNRVVPNSEYKMKIINAFDNYSNSSDGAMIVKQSEMVRYFGFALGNFDKREIQITDTGIEMYNAHQSGDTHKEYRLIAEAIQRCSFGRNNSAIKSSDADIDPPKLFVKSIIALNGITVGELKLLLALTNDYNLDFESAIGEINAVREDDKTIQIPAENVNKYGDTKFGAFLTEIDFCFKDDGKYHLSKWVLDNYRDVFEKMSIYNTSPEVTYTTVEYVEPTDNDGEFDDVYKKHVSTTIAYDIESEYFKKQNERKPKQSTTKSGKTGYVTNVRIAKTALELAEYKCKKDNSHLTFTNKSGKPFMELHHLVPMAAQDDFENNLDCIENLVSLCPTCHSAIHYGNDDVRYEMVKELYEQKCVELKKANINIDLNELFEKYYK